VREGRGEGTDGGTEGGRDGVERPSNKELKAIQAWEKDWRGVKASFPSCNRVPVDFQSRVWWCCGAAHIVAILGGGRLEGSNEFKTPFGTPAFLRFLFPQTCVVCTGVGGVRMMGGDEERRSRLADFRSRWLNVR